jgi:glucokinase
MTRSRDNRVVLALDIGGTNLKGAIVGSLGEPLAFRTVDTKTQGEELLRRVSELLGSLADDATAAGYSVVGAGVATPGIVEADTGTVGYASTLGWKDMPLGSVLSADLGVPVIVEHDVRTAGVAESLFGAASGVSDFVLIALGTGVAASIVSGGASVSGVRNAGGELGHIPAIPDGEACTCGQRGCLEVYMSGAGLARRYLALGGDAPRSAQEISLRLDTDPIAERVWTDAVRALALGLKTLTLLVDPSVFVLGGGLSNADELLLDPLRTELTESLAWRDAPPVRRSPLGTVGGRIGASVLAFRAAGHPETIADWTTDSVLSLPADALPAYPGSGDPIPRFA